MKIAILSCGIFLSVSSVADSVQAIPFFPSASGAWGRLGFAQVTNRSGNAGDVTIEAIDDEGETYVPLTLSINPGETVHFNSVDLEYGNGDKGLSGSTGPGRGDWRLRLASELDIEVVSYIRTSDGLLTPMHDTAPWRDGGYHLAIFNPGSDRVQQSLLRLVNLGETTASVAISGVDDAGAFSAGTVIAKVPAGAVRTYSAAELESGNAIGLDGSLGDGDGKWQLTVRSDQAVAVMGLLASSTGYLTNLSTIPDSRINGIQSVPLFPSVSDPLGRQGFVRVINHSKVSGEVSIKPFDDTGQRYGALTLSLGANETKHFNSYDVEIGNAQKGLTGSTGAGTGDWRLELSSDLTLGVLSYVRSTNGVVAPVHDTVPRAVGAYHVTAFPPGADHDQASLLRLVNATEETANVAITAVDDAGEQSAGQASVALAPGASRTLSVRELEDGGKEFVGAIAVAKGKRQLVVESKQPIEVLSLLSGPNGQLANLSNGPTDEITQTFDFSLGEQGFIADFADYPPDNKGIYELTSDYRPLPSPLESESALYLSGVNRSGDLFMFFKGQIGGLLPGVTYHVAVSVEIATDTPSGCFGVGGSPGESVWIKAGASENEPLPVLQGSFLRMNIDIGRQANGGENAIVLGDMANSRSCEQPRQWERKSFQARSIPEPVTAPADDRVWLFFGTDSGFESRTEVYFTRSTVILTPMRPNGLLPAPHPIPLRWLPPRKDRPDIF